MPFEYRKWAAMIDDDLVLRAKAFVNSVEAGAPAASIEASPARPRASERVLASDLRRLFSSASGEKLTSSEPVAGVSL